MFVELSEKYLKIGKQTSVFDMKLFKRNYYSEYSGIGFVTYDIKVYLIEFFFLIMHETTDLTCSG